MTNNKLNFRRLKQTDIPLLRDWHESPDFLQYLSSPDDNWFQYISNNEEVLFWMIDNVQTPVGFIQIDVSDESAAIAFAIAPQEQRKGLGKKMLSAVKDLLPVSVSTLEAFVEPSNLASQKVLNVCGYMSDQVQDEDGMIRYSLHLR